MQVNIILQTMRKSHTNQNVSGCNFDLWKSLEVRSDGAVNGHSIYDFPLVLNGNLWSKSAALGDISLRNLSNFDFNLSRSNVMVPVDSPYMIY